MRCLFISPHLDDAVFSCAARIRRRVESGAEVTVATVFTHARPRSAAAVHYAARRAEDRAALRQLGAHPRWLGLLDAPGRSPYYDSFRRIVLGVATGDWPQIHGVRRRLVQLLHELAPDEVYLPLGVGTHIDHRLVFSAAKALPFRGPQFFYEDQPYAGVRHAVAFRLATLGLAPGPGAMIAPARDRAGLMRQFVQSFRRAAYVRRYLPPGGERRACEAVLRHLWVLPAHAAESWHSEMDLARAADEPRLLAALYAYVSQARLFLGPPRRFASASRVQARAFDADAWRVERYWKPAPMRQAMPRLSLPAPETGRTPGGPARGRGYSANRKSQA